MKLLKIGLVQQHCTADIQDNIQRLQGYIREAAAQGAELVVLQELYGIRRDLIP